MDIFDLKTLNHIASLPSEDETIRMKVLGVWDDGRALVVDAKRVVIWDFLKDEEVTVSAFNRVSSAALSPDGKVLVTDTWWELGDRFGNPVELWSAEDGRMLDAIPGAGWGCKSVRFAEDATKLLLVKRDEIIVLDIKQREIVRKLSTPELRCVAVSPERNEVLLRGQGSDGKQVATVDLQTGQTALLKGHKSLVMGGHYSWDGKLLITGDESGVVYVWSRKSKKALLCLGSSGNKDWWNVVLRSDGKMLMVGGNLLEESGDRLVGGVRMKRRTTVPRVSFWDLEQRKCTRALEFRQGSWKEIDCDEQVLKSEVSSG